LDSSSPRRFLGLFLADPLAVPMGAIRYVATHLGIEDLTKLTRYAERTQTQWDHQAEIRSRFGYREFNDPRGGFALLRFLYAREWVSAERPGILFDLAITWLVDHKVLLPGNAGWNVLSPAFGSASPNVSGSA
jgi:Domain of unknown function (DUF4158)